MKNAPNNSYAHDYELSRSYYRIRHTGMCQVERTIAQTYANIDDWPEPILRRHEHRYILLHGNIGHIRHSRGN